MPATSTKRRTRFARALGSLAVACMLAGGSMMPAAHAAPARAVQITFWGPFSGPDGAALVKLVDQFNSSQSGINVKLTINPNGNYDQSLATAISAHRAPNIFTVDDVAMATFADAGVLQPLEKTVAKVKGLASTNFPKSLWNGGIYGKHLYAIPMDALPLTFYWNKAVFKSAGLNPNKPPTDEKSFIADAKKINKGDVAGFIVPPGWPQPFVFPTLLAQFGGKEMDEKSKKALYNTKAGINALKLEYDWIYKDKISPENTATDFDVKALSTGKAGMIVDGPWMYGKLHDALGSDLGVGAVPKWGTKKGVFIGQHYFALYKGGASAATNRAALEFVQYFQKNSIAWARTGDLPAYKPTFRSSAFKKLSYELAISKMLPYGVLSPKVPKYGSFNSTLYPQITLALTGKKDVKAALDYATAQTTKAAQGG